MSRNFTRDELIRSTVALARGIDNTPPGPVLVHLEFTIAGAERIRSALGAPLIISSGYRSPELNAAVHGSKTSQHMLGQALDFVCPAFGDPEKIVRELAPKRRVLGIDQMILEKTWVHVSFTLEDRKSVV